MGFVIITGLITLLALYSTYSCLKSKHFLGLGFSLVTLAIFGFFTIMTIIHNGYPESSMN